MEIKEKGSSGSEQQQPIAKKEATYSLKGTQQKTRISMNKMQ